MFDPIYILLYTSVEKCIELVKLIISIIVDINFDTDAGLSSLIA